MARKVDVIFTACLSPASRSGARARRATNVSLDAALLKEAKLLDINISRACEQGLAAQIAELRAARWRTEKCRCADSLQRLC